MSTMEDRIKQVIASIMTSLCFVLFYYSNYTGDIAGAAVYLFVGVFSFLFSIHLNVEEGKTQ